MKPLQRRSFVKRLVIGTSAALVGGRVSAKIVTPSEMEGPYYPITPQKDKDTDLTKLKGRTGIAKGEIIEITGQILDHESKPVEDATIDLWQANTYGKYHHPHDKNPAPVDENFQPWAIFQSGKEGAFTFKTIMPGIYPITGTNMIRTPHIHFKISKNGYISLLTQMYFPNHPINVQDPLIKRKTVEETEMMTAKLVSTTEDKINRYHFNMHMEKI